MRSIVTAVFLAVTLGACRAPVPRPADPRREGALENARAIDAIVRSGSIDRRDDLEDRRADLARRLALLAEARDDPEVARGFTVGQWQSLARATEEGTAHLAELDRLARIDARPPLGIRSGSGPSEDLVRHLDLRPGEGLVVVSVEPGSPASEWGIVAGDVVVAIDEAPVNDLDVLWMRYEALARGESIVLEWFHRGSRRTIEIGR